MKLVDASSVFCARWKLIIRNKVAQALHDLIQEYCYDNLKNYEDSLVF